MGLWVVLALLTGTKEANEAATTAALQVPLALWTDWVDVSSSVTPEVDALWPVDWLTRAEAESEPMGDTEAGELPRYLPPATPNLSRRAISAERWEEYFPSRIELGIARLREIENKPRFYPAGTRVVFGGPLGLLEGLMSAVMPSHVIVNGRLLFSLDESSDDLATIAGRTLLTKEMSFFSGLRNSYINTPQVAMGLQEFDHHRYMQLQSRAIFDALKNAYRERYHVPSLDMDTMLGTVATGEWFDVVLLPTVASVYAARFGVHRRFKIGDELKFEIQVEKGTRFYKVLTHDHGGRLFTGAVQIFNLPIKAIVSLEGAHRGVGVGFVGIGTDIDSVLQATTHPRDVHTGLPE